MYQAMVAKRVLVFLKGPPKPTLGFRNQHQDLVLRDVILPEALVQHRYRVWRSIGSDAAAQNTKIAGHWLKQIHDSFQLAS